MRCLSLTPSYKSNRMNHSNTRIKAYNAKLELLDTNLLCCTYVREMETTYAGVGSSVFSFIKFLITICGLLGLWELQLFLFYALIPQNRDQSSQVMVDSLLRLKKVVNKSSFCAHLIFDNLIIGIIIQSQVNQTHLGKPET